MAARDYGNLHYDVEVARPAEKEAKRGSALRYVVQNIIKPLQDAKKAEPKSVGPRLEEMAWLQDYWRFAPNDNNRTKMLKEMSQIVELDPHGSNTLVRELHVHLELTHVNPLMFADPVRLERFMAVIRGEEFKQAVELIPKILDRDPALEARLRFRLAEALFAVKDPERDKQGMDEANRALELDANAPGPRWRLTDAQRAQVKKWLKLE